MIVNAGLWCALFFHQDLPLLGWLQVAFLVFATYGLAQWAIVKSRIGWNPSVPADLVGGGLGLGLLAYALWTYRDMPGYAGDRPAVDRAGIRPRGHRRDVDGRVSLQAQLVALVGLVPPFLPLAVHSRLWGPFTMTFVYQAINVVGWFQWVRDEKRLSSVPVDVEGRIAAVTAPARTS